MVSSAATGVKVSKVGPDGVPSIGCSASAPHPLRLLEGRYRLEVVAPDLAPAEVEFDVLAGRDNAVTVRFGAGAPERR